MTPMQTSADDNAKTRVAQSHSSNIEKRMTCEEKIVAGLAPNNSFDAMDMPQEVLDMLGVAKDQVSA